MSVLVTGGAGFIGSHVLDRLAAAGRRAVCLDDFNDHYSPAVKRRNIAGALATGQVELVEGDICDLELCRHVFKQHAVDRVIHLAARAGVRHSLQQPLLYERVNCGGTLALLECARDAAVKMFVFGSTSSVYGASQRVPFREDDPVAQPISPYAATKRACDPPVGSPGPYPAASVRSAVAFPLDASLSQSTPLKWIVLCPLKVFKKKPRPQAACPYAPPPCPRRPGRHIPLGFTVLLGSQLLK